MRNLRKSFQNQRRVESAQRLCSFENFLLDLPKESRQKLHEVAHETASSRQTIPMRPLRTQGYSEV